MISSQPLVRIPLLDLTRSICTYGAMLFRRSARVQEAHEVRKSGAAYKTGAEWHRERNSNKDKDKRAGSKK
eukprot:SAG22_NODE_315_length_12535_cov_3.240351_6_plen_71_part_00